MTSISNIFSGSIPGPYTSSERSAEHGLLHSMLALLLASVMLIFTVSAVNQTRSHFKSSLGQQEVLQLIPTIAASDALITDSVTSLFFTVYFFIYFLYRLNLQALTLTYALKESLFIPSFLRNPFYVFTSIHAP